MIAPRVHTSALTPAYQWRANSVSTRYHLEVAYGDGRRFRQWYTSAQTGCASGTSVCQITPPAVLTAGAAWWRIQTYNGAGFGPWTDWLAFQAAPRRHP